jgi:hypothetical protein
VAGATLACSGPRLKRQGAQGLPITTQERAILTHYLAILLDANEPEAMLGSLQRLAEHKAHSVTRGKIGESESARWYALAVALSKVRRELNA